MDDHALFREGLLRLLSNDSEFELTGATGDADQAIADISASPPDILILDYDLGEKTAVDVVRMLQQRDFRGRILLVTAGLPDRDALTRPPIGILDPCHHLRDRSMTGSP